MSPARPWRWQGPAAMVLVLLASVLVLFGLISGPDASSKRFDPVVTEADVGQALRALAEFDVVAAWEPAPEYDRDEYMPGGWADADGDCQDTRQEMLANQSWVRVSWSGDDCDVEAGEWVDPYTGSRFSDPTQLDVDHVVALAAAHRAGAWRMSPSDREAFANDMSDSGVGLAVVETSVNQSKGDRGPDAWMPPQASARCSYAIRWITVKDRWELQASPAEVRALREAVSRCIVEQPAG